MKNHFDLFIFAGEASGDIHGREIIKKIKQRCPNISICAVSGSEMKKENITTILDMEKFQVMGFINILFFLPKIIKNFFFLKKQILKLNPKTCLFIDYPDFNFFLQSSLKKSNYKGKIIHYICPSIWAWRKNRINKMKKNLDLLLYIYPFEKKYLENKITSKYVGNPLINKLKNHIYDNELPLKTSPKIGIFPGSRFHEIKKNLFFQLKAAEEITKTHPHFFFAISVAGKKHQIFISKIVKNFSKDLQQKLILIPKSRNYDLMNNIKFAIATSGTINLELAFHYVPTIVTYYISPFDLFIAKNILRINLPYYCIVNIIAKSMIFPELYGPNLTLENLSYYVNKLLREKSYKENIINRCKIIKKCLSKKANLRIQQIQFCL